MPVDSGVTAGEASECVRPRLLNMRQAGEYSGCSFWTVRTTSCKGLIPVAAPAALARAEGARQRRTVRRVLVARTDLDAFIDSRKRPHEA